MIAKLVGILALITLGLGVVVGAVAFMGSVTDRLAEERLAEGEDGRVPAERGSQRPGERAGRREGIRRGRPGSPAGEPRVRTLDRDVGRVGGDVLRVVGTIARALLIAVGALAAIALTTRAADRRRRASRLYALTPGREESTSADHVRNLCATWAAVMRSRRRRLRRLFLGMPPFVLWIVAVPRAGHPTEVRWLVQIPDDEDLAAAFDGALKEAYRDCRMRAVEGQPVWARHVVRLKKSRPIPMALEAPDGARRQSRLSEGFESQVVDGIASALSALGEPAGVQYVLTVVPRPFERLVRTLARRGQRGTARSGPLEEQEDRLATVSMVNQPLLFGELRVAAGRYAPARDVAMAISGRSWETAQLRERRPVLRRRLYALRFRRGVGNPLPSWWRGVLSASEISWLWRLPTPHLKGVAIERDSVPRIPAPPKLPRTGERELALLRDEEGTMLTISVDDLPYGIGVQGGQGLGKTALLTQIVSLGAHHGADRASAARASSKGEGG